MKNWKVFAGLLVALTLLVTAQTAQAQSTIFNIPTTDTVAKGRAYAEFDFLAQAPAPSGSRLYIYNPRLVVGVSDTLEVGVNFPIADGAETFGYIQPNFKYKYYNNDDAGVALSAGALLQTPLNKRDGQDSWGILYTLVSKKVKSSTYGPRLHAGPYGIVSANQDITEGPVSFLGPRGGIILGYEQPVHARVSVVADWFSGKNYFGYFTPGISITLPGNGLLNVGYSVGNDSWANSNATKNRSFFAYYGVTF
jgi:hypothetical protein